MFEEPFFGKNHGLFLKNWLPNYFFPYCRQFEQIPTIIFRILEFTNYSSLSLSLVGRRGRIPVMIVLRGQEESISEEEERGREGPTEEGDKTGGSAANQRARPTEKEAEGTQGNGEEETILIRSEIKRMIPVSVMIWRVIGREEEVRVGGTGGGRARKLRLSLSIDH